MNIIIYYPMVVLLRHFFWPHRSIRPQGCQSCRCDKCLHPLPSSQTLRQLMAAHPPTKSSWRSRKENPEEAFSSHFSTPNSGDRTKIHKTGKWVCQHSWSSPHAIIGLNLGESKLGWGSHRYLSIHLQLKASVLAADCVVIDW